MNDELLWYCPNRENLEILNNLNLTYSEMSTHFIKKQNGENIKNYFHRLGIKKKVKTDFIKDILEENPFLSNQQVAIKVGCSKRMVEYVRHDIKKKTYVKFNYTCGGKKFQCIISGHSNYAAYGRDIVCASISTLCQFMANTFSQYQEGVNIIQKEAYYEFELEIYTDLEFIFVKSFVEHVEELERQFPENIKIVL